MMMLTRKSKQALGFFLHPFQMRAVSLTHEVALPFFGFTYTSYLMFQVMLFSKLYLKTYSAQCPL